MKTYILKELGRNLTIDEYVDVLSIVKYIRMLGLYLVEDARVSLRSDNCCL